MFCHRSMSWDQNGEYFHVFAYTVIRYCTPSCLYASFHTDSGPSENSRSGVEDETHSSGPMQHLSLAITSHIVSSKCITLQQESLHPTLSPIQIYGLCASIITHGRDVQHYPATLNCFLPKLFLVFLLSLPLLLLLQWIEADSVCLCF